MCYVFTIWKRWRLGSHPLSNILIMTDSLYASFPLSRLDIQSTRGCNAGQLLFVLVLHEKKKCRSSRFLQLNSFNSYMQLCRGTREGICITDDACLYVRLILSIRLYHQVLLGSWPSFPISSHAFIHTYMYRCMLVQKRRQRYSFHENTPPPSLYNKAHITRRLYARGSFLPVCMAMRAHKVSRHAEPYFIFHFFPYIFFIFLFSFRVIFFFISLCVTLAVLDGVPGDTMAGKAKFEILSFILADVRSWCGWIQCTEYAVHSTCIVLYIACLKSVVYVHICMGRTCLSCHSVHMRFKPVSFLAMLPDIYLDIEIYVKWS